MDVLVRWTGPDTMSFVAETGSGHAVVMDGAPEGGGRNLGPRPMEMVLLGSGGCTAYDVVLILRKSGQDIRGCEVALKADRAETDPKVFTRIVFRFTVRGRGLKPAFAHARPHRRCDGRHGVSITVLPDSTRRHVASSLRRLL